MCGLGGLWPNDTLTVGLPLPIQITSHNPLYITLHSHIFFSQDIYRLPTLIIFCSRLHIYFCSVDRGREGGFNSYVQSRHTIPKQQWFNLCLILQVGFSTFSDVQSFTVVVWNKTMSWQKQRWPDKVGYSDKTLSFEVLVGTFQICRSNSWSSGRQSCHR